LFVDLSFEPILLNPKSSLISYIKRTMKPPLTPRDEAAPEAAR